MATLALSAAQGRLLGGVTQIAVDATHADGPLSRTLTGSCIEDVNHEIYGGLYSQMIFGESFQEPCVATLEGFETPDGALGFVERGELVGQGPRSLRKAVSAAAPLVGDGKAGVELFFQNPDNVFAGLVFHVTRADEGPDSFVGYEIAMNPSKGVLRLARHDYHYHLLKSVALPIPCNAWISLSVTRAGTVIEVSVDGRVALRYDDGSAALAMGAVGVRQTQGGARFRDLWMQRPGGAREGIPFKPAEGIAAGVSREWRAIRTGSADGEIRLEAQQAFVGRQSQRLTFLAGAGRIGVSNAGLFGRPPGGEANHSGATAPGGMNLVSGQPYDGCLCVRAQAACDLAVDMESADGSRIYAQAILHVEGGDRWRKLDFTLVPGAADPAGRFAVSLGAPGSVVLGYAFLEPGPWGRFRGLPVRKDVAEGLIDQGVTVLRYGGSMVNAEGYRWKRMLGSREGRQPYAGTWYPYSSNGWGIPDFLDLCDAAGILGIPAISMDETPQDVVDLVEYANGAPESEWGGRRAAAGHPRPYGLRIVEIGNEQKVDEAYWARFQAIAAAVWSRYPGMILVVGDYAYADPIRDPFHFTGAYGGITTLAAHQKILELARRFGAEVWFDVHIETDGPPEEQDPLGTVRSYNDAIDSIANGASHRVVVFEMNAERHDQSRALGNALAIQEAERMGDRIPVVISANGLQPDGHNDNGWDQGLLFMDSSAAWLQPPGYVTRMISRQYEPMNAPCSVSPPDRRLQVSAARSADGNVLVIQVVNSGDAPLAADLSFLGFRPAPGKAMGEVLAGPPRGTNPAHAKRQIVPLPMDVHVAGAGEATCTFQAYSFTVLRLEQ